MPESGWHLEIHNCGVRVFRTPVRLCHAVAVLNGSSWDLKAQTMLARHPSSAIVICWLPEGAEAGLHQEWLSYSPLSRHNPTTFAGICRNAGDNLEPVFKPLM